MEWIAVGFGIIGGLTVVAFAILFYSMKQD
jgi:hypothetical protein